MMSFNAAALPRKRIRDDCAPSFLFLQYETALGTAALTTATLSVLKQLVPDAHITVAGAGLPANVVRASSLVDEIIETPHAVRESPDAAGYLACHVWPSRAAIDYVIVDSAAAIHCERRARLASAHAVSAEARTLRAQGRTSRDVPLRHGPGCK